MIKEGLMDGLMDDGSFTYEMVDRGELEDELVDETNVR